VKIRAGRFLYPMKKLVFFLFLTPALAQENPAPAMRQAATAFLASLDEAQRQQATFEFDHAERVNWHFVPRPRKGLPLKAMSAPQRKAALALLQTGLSVEGYEKATSIIDLENVLRVVENRSGTDTYRDPENYYFSVFGTPNETGPWGWRAEGHHLSLQFSSLTNRVISSTPRFLGANPGVVRAEVPQKGRQVLKQETELALRLVQSLGPEQVKRAVLSETSPGNIFTGNSRKASLAKQEGIPFSELTAAQQVLFRDLLNAYLRTYHLTLARQQLAQLEQTGLDRLVFAWAGDRQAGYGPGRGQYYRIHGPTILIEYDNSQNEANHVHTVVRDLTNDFGDDLLAEHYRQQHAAPKP
jgi:hypothetical protein